MTIITTMLRFMMMLGLSAAYESEESRHHASGVLLVGYGRLRRASVLARASSPENYECQNRGKQNDSESECQKGIHG
jgi:hypothetical protein